jgi:hypothetical protein
MKLLFLKMLLGSVLLSAPECKPIKNDSLLTDGKWIKVSDVYLANGKESYLTIGVFTEALSYPMWKALKRKYYNKKAHEKGAYYYIDDVSVVLIE